MSESWWIRQFFHGVVGDLNSSGCTDATLINALINEHTVFSKKWQNDHFAPVSICWIASPAGNDDVSISDHGL
jgi:hypothetical protein